jgi:hypothetical protein
MVSRRALAWGAAGVGALLLLRRGGGVDFHRQLSAREVAAFPAILPKAAWPYALSILEVSASRRINPLLLVALGEQESRWMQGAGYAPKGSVSGLGDGGRAVGPFQIHRTAHPEWVAEADLGDIRVHMAKALDVFLGSLRFLAGKGYTDPLLHHAAVAAYNTGAGNVLASLKAGRGPDATTKGGAYGMHIIARMEAFERALAAAQG